VNDESNNHYLLLTYPQILISSTNPTTYTTRNKQLEAMSWRLFRVGQSQTTLTPQMCLTLSISIQYTETLHKSKNSAAVNLKAVRFRKTKMRGQWAFWRQQPEQVLDSIFIHLHSGCNTASTSKINDILQQCRLDIECFVPNVPEMNLVFPHTTAFTIDKPSIS